MGRSSFAQDNFLGGEWSPFMQGRFTHPRYKTALATCVNSYPVEAGSWTRRPGFRYQAYTRGGVVGRMIPYRFSSQTPYNLELTSGHMRLYNGVQLVFLQGGIFTCSAISTADPAVVQTSTSHNYSTGDTVQFIFATPAQYQNPSIGAPLRNRQFTITKVDSTHFSLQDAITGSNIDGSTLNINTSTVTTYVGKVVDIVTPWLGTSIQQVRLTQEDSLAVFTHQSYPPYTLSVVPGIDPTTLQTVATYTFAIADIHDGPYFPIPTNGAFLYPALANASYPNQVELFVNFPTWSSVTPYKIGDLVEDAAGAFESLIDSNVGNTPESSPSAWVQVDAGVINGPSGFTSADIGRHVRLLSQPNTWASGTTYAAGAAVTYNGAYYVSQQASNVGQEPDTQQAWWLPSASLSVATWTWGKITAVGTGLSPRMTVNIYGPPLLYVDTTPGDNIILSYQLGVWGGAWNSATTYASGAVVYYNDICYTSLENGNVGLEPDLNPAQWQATQQSGGCGYPSIAAFHEGRLWFGGAVPNELDSSNSNDFFNMAPTLADGTVTDANGIQATFLADDTNPALWMSSSDYGLIIGTRGSEFRCAASVLDDPITPSTVQVRRVTKYGCAAQPALRIGHAVLFTQRYERAMYEMITEPFTNRVIAQSLSYAAKHVTVGQIAELAYQEELVPIVWARMANGLLAGCTYRRVNLTASEEPSFFGWHRHTHGQGNTFESICVGASSDGTIDLFSAVTYNATSSLYQVEFATPLFDEAATYTQAWFMDGATTISGAAVTTVDGVEGLQLYGLWPHNGNTPTFFLGGLDCGTATVTGGAAFIPFGTYGNVTFNLAYIESVATSLGNGSLTAGNAFCYIANSGTAYAFSAVVGYPYTSRGQLMRPVIPQETGAQLGLGFAKIKRQTEYGISLYNAVSEQVNIGTTFTSMYPLVLRANGDGTTENTAAQLYTDVFWDTLSDDYGMDSQLAWQISTPYPLTVTGVGGFIETADR